MSAVGLCVNAPDPDLWTWHYPRGRETAERRAERHARVQLVCFDCPIWVGCLRDRLASDVAGEGVFGGMVFPPSGRRSQERPPSYWDPEGVSAKQREARNARKREARREAKASKAPEVAA
jgi:hypothetical protein